MLGSKGNGEGGGWDGPESNRKRLQARRSQDRVEQLTVENHKPAGSLPRWAGMVIYNVISVVGMGALGLREGG